MPEQTPDQTPNQMQDQIRQLAAAITVALELIEQQNGAILSLKASIFTLSATLAPSQQPPVPFDTAFGLVLEKMRANGETLDALKPLLSKHLARVRLLSK